MPDYLSTSEFKSQMRIEHGEEDALIGRLLDASEAYLGDPENGILGRPVVQQAFSETFSGFSGLRLKYPDEVSDLSISYVDDEGAAQVLGEIYTLSDGVLRLNYGEAWPSHVGPVVADYTAGWAVVPAQIVQAGYFIAGSFYEARHSEEMRPDSLRKTVAGMVAGYRRIGL